MPQIAFLKQSFIEEKAFTYLFYSVEACKPCSPFKAKPKWQPYITNYFRWDSIQSLLCKIITI